MKIILTAAALAAFALAPAYAAEDSMKMEARPAGSMAMSAKMDGMAVKPARKHSKMMAAKPMAGDKMKDDTMKMDGMKH